MKAAIADYFGVSLDYLYGRTDLRTAPHSGEDDLKAAFWGGEKDLTKEDLDELWEDVAEYARYKADQRRKKKQNDGPD